MKGSKKEHGSYVEFYHEEYPAEDANLGDVKFIDQQCAGANAQDVSMRGGAECKGSKRNILRPRQGGRHSTEHHLACKAQGLAPMPCR